jgi:hypothetical protein
MGEADGMRVHVVAAVFITLTSFAMSLSALSCAIIALAELRGCS